MEEEEQEKECIKMNQQLIQERRTLRRWDVSLKVVLKDNDQERNVFAEDISNKGIRLLLEKDVEIAQEIEVVIELASLGKVFAKAMPVWKRIDTKGRVYMGLEFTQIGDFQRGYIFNYVLHYHREQVLKAWWEGLSPKYPPSPNT